MEDITKKELQEHKKPKERDMQLSIDNETIRSPGEPSFQYPKGKEGKGYGLASRGYAGCTICPRG